MSNNTNWLTLTEDNEWENETWHFHFPMTENNIKAFEVIKKIIVDNELEGGFRVSELANFSAEQLIALPNHGSYMNTHNVFEGELDVERLSNIKEYDNEFYKGQIEYFIIKE